MMFADAFRSKTVWVSGHTGFKGSWLTQWLLELGARVTGFSLPPPTRPALFEQLELEDRINHQTADVRNLAAVTESIQAAQPDYVFHLAAQPLVRLSYEIPVETYDTNVMGTIHVLEALRTLEKPCMAVFITSDKCYENREWLYGYREEDALGGRDPYSSSKGAAEIAVSAWRRSFFSEHPVRVASARAGNVIGGGDWAADRIVPDCIRALQENQPITVRNPASTRPWQHVLEPLSGYLWLAALLASPHDGQIRPEVLCSAFNFGPLHEANRTVGELVREVLKHWPGRSEDKGIAAGAVHEAGLLKLSTDKAYAMLGWSPTWDFRTTVAQTVKWYQQANATSESAAIRRMTQEQIEAYSAAAQQMGVVWSSK
jgi:CDP-glucose 4,6-dehydratase